MERKWLAAWISQVWIRGSFGPVITLILIAGKTAVDKVIERISAAFNARLKMINRQFITGIGFVNAAVLTAKN